MKISKIITTCIAILAFVSCTDTNDWKDGTRTPSLKASFIYFPQSQIYLGGTNDLSSSFQLQAVETPWKFTNPASDWLVVSPMEGNGDATITFTAKENPTSDNVRTALLSLESLDADYSFSHSLIINQGRANSVLNPSEQNFELTREAQTKTVSITTNTDWTASCSADWVHLTKISDTSLEIKVDENDGTTDRQTNINIAGSTSSLITVLQHGYKFEDLISEITFESKASTRTLTLETDGAWIATSDKSWIHISPKSGIGGDQISVSVDDNNGTDTRKGAISVIVGDITKYVLIHQSGAYLNISASSDSEIFAIGGTRTITFSTSDDWTVICQNNSWVSVDKTSGTAGINTITLTFSKNTQETSRTDITYIKSQNTNIQNLKIITVQKGDDFSISHEYVDLELPSGTIWATCNIGANSPEEYGDYFAWGETRPKEIYDGINYEWIYYKWCEGSYKTMTKYCTNSLLGILDNQTELYPEDDAATTNWGSNWCMPSIEQIEELHNPLYTNWVRSTQNGVNGYLVTSKKNGKTLFLPAAGHFLSKGGNDGFYWSRSLGVCLLSGANYTACCLKFFSTSSSPYLSTEQRKSCFSVRPVLVISK